MLAVLKRINPSSNIVSIKGHKLGPVYALFMAKNEIRKNESVLVSYCDYYMDWNFSDFKNQMELNDYDGCVPCYTGFHPHLLHEKNLYASCLIDNKYRLLRIKEKFSFEKDKTKGFHSPGAYYFKNGDQMNYFLKRAIDEDLSLNGEFYVSLVYNLMIEEGLYINVYDQINHFCQWGTPEDLEEYMYWHSIFERKNNSQDTQ
jgi:NDP-sugar pyrophosphorylase family protein